MIKKIIINILPPFFLQILKYIKKKLKTSEQNINLYFTEEMANILETWGERNAWIEIQHFFLGKEKNKILDIACGTGKVIQILNQNLNIKEVYGCDISDLLISKAISRGINPNYLKICDATKMPYKENDFDYSYSIGSLEHFKINGIKDFLIGCKKITKFESLHLIPVSKSGQNHGWIKTYQSYYNNSINWWLEICSKIFEKKIKILDSSWEDQISVGKWLILKK